MFLNIRAEALQGTFMTMNLEYIFCFSYYFLINLSSPFFNINFSLWLVFVCVGVN